METIVEGWLLTGDLGRFDKSGHLQLFGRKKNMIVTEGGKNIYPEDIETVFDGLPVKEYCVFAANYVWPQKELGREMLVMAVRLEQNQRFDSALLGEIVNRNRRLPDFKRVGGYVVWEKDFPRTASMKIKRQELAEEIGKTLRSGERWWSCEWAVTYLAIVNPAAGGGRGRKMLGSALERLRAGGVAIDVAETSGAGDATRTRARSLRGADSGFHRGGWGWNFLRGGERSFSGGGARVSVRRWGSCRWGRGILFCAISATAG